MDIKFHTIAGTYSLTAKVRLDSKIFYYVVIAKKTKADALTRLFYLIEQDLQPEEEVATQTPSEELVCA